MEQRADILGKKVFVYWNLHKNLYSVQHKGKVVFHATSIKLKDAFFVVRESGRKKVLREKCKNVHAGVRGYIQDIEFQNGKSRQKVATYNPYKYESFVNKKTLEKVEFSRFVTMLCFDGKPKVSYV